MTTATSSSPPGSFGRRLDHFLHEAFANEESRLYHVVNTIIVIVICISIVAVALETVQSIYTPYQNFFDGLEIVIVCIFAVEYAINIYVAHDRKAYIFGPWGIIDLLAIAPGFFFFVDLRALQVGRVLRIVRFLRLMRILRALKAAKLAVKQNAARRQRLNTLRMDLQIYLLALFSAVAIFSTLAYYAEERVPNTQFTSIPQAMWWCIATLTTTGYGDMYPTTPLGRFIGAVTMLVGLALFGLLINVVGKGMLSSLFGASDLESHDEAARTAASLIAERRRRLARRLGDETVTDTTGKILLGDAAEAMLLDQSNDCAGCGRELAADWRICPYCGRARA